MLEMVVKAVSNFSYHDLSYICVYLSQYLEFVGKLFCSTLCTYSRVFDTPVPQAFVCDTSEEANLVLKRIYPTWNFWVNSFVPYFIHIIVSFAHLCLKALCVIHL